MKIVWVSPEGEHLPIAHRIKDQGHAVVAYGVAGDLPVVPKTMLAQTAKVADLVVVDGPHPLRKTRRSWAPSVDSLFFDEMRRHYDVVALGPTPTVDLLVGDPRYLRKMCTRFDIPFDVQAVGDSWSSGAWFRGKEVIPPGPYLDPFQPLFSAVGFRGWFCLHGVLTSDGPIVQAADASWAADTVPEGQEVAWLSNLSRST